MNDKIGELVLEEIFKLSDKFDKMQEKMQWMNENMATKQYVDKRFEEQEEKINKRFEEQEEKINKRFEEQEEKMNKRFKEQEQKFDKKLDERFKKFGEDIMLEVTWVSRVAETRNDELKTEIMERVENRIKKLKIV